MASGFHAPNMANRQPCHTEVENAGSCILDYADESELSPLYPLSPQLLPPVKSMGSAIGPGTQSDLASLGIARGESDE